MTRKMRTSLLPCPFCGGKAHCLVEHPRLLNGKRDTLYRVECTRRDCSISTLPWYPKRAAVHSWNRRIDER